VYDRIDSGLRFQLWKIWRAFFGEYASGEALYEAYKVLQRSVENEILKKELPPSGQFQPAFQKLENLFIEDLNLNDSLDFMQIALDIMVLFDHQPSGRAVLNKYKGNAQVASAVEEMNTRFMEHCVGYYVANHGKPELIRRDEELSHQEIIIPALQLLYDEQFSGADAEYRSAHAHYLQGRNRECLADCQSAFESTMKTICERRAWTYPTNSTASNLIKICLDNGLLPTFLESHLNTIRQGLQDGAPVIRNKLGPHGQGETVRDVPDELAAYMLREVGNNIILLVDAFRTATGKR